MKKYLITCNEKTFSMKDKIEKVEEFAQALFNRFKPALGVDIIENGKTIKIIDK